MLLPVFFVVPVALGQYSAEYSDILSNSSLLFREEVSLPSVTVSPTTLGIYGLQAAYGPEPKTRPTKDQALAFWKNLKEKTVPQIFNQLENGTTVDVGEAVREVWNKTNDQVTKEYFQWATAHLLNFFFAGHSLRLPFEQTADDALAIAMGKCRGPEHPRLGSTFSRIAEAAGEAGQIGECRVTGREAWTALEILKAISGLTRIWQNLLADLTTGRFDSTSKIPYPTWVAVEFFRLGTSYRPDLSQFGQSYFYLLCQEVASFDNQTAEEFVNAGRVTELGLFRPKEPESEEDEDLSGSDVSSFSEAPEDD